MLQGPSAGKAGTTSLEKRIALEQTMGRSLMRPIGSVRCATQCVIREPNIDRKIIYASPVVEENIPVEGPCGSREDCYFKINDRLLRQCQSDMVRACIPIITKFVDEYNKNPGKKFKLDPLGGGAEFPVAFGKSNAYCIPCTTPTIG